MINFIISIKLILFSFRILPHIIVYKCSYKMHLFRDEMSTLYGGGGLRNFIWWMKYKPYIRNLFYHRIGYKFKILFHWLCNEDQTLHISVKQIGKQCHLEHSQNTFLNAEKIGENFYCLHNVTIGNDNGSHQGKPQIGDNVRIMTGAVVLGGITIGNNVVIAANAVVRNDVPDNTLVGGIPAKILRYNK